MFVVARPNIFRPDIFSEHASIAIVAERGSVDPLASAGLHVKSLVNRTKLVDPASRADPAGRDT